MKRAHHSRRSPQHRDRKIINPALWRLRRVAVHHSECSAFIIRVDRRSIEIGKSSILLFGVCDAFAVPRSERRAHIIRNDRCGIEPEIISPAL
ncbi:MAG TPA: hypothetical protein VFF06_23375 [Polyangia bacterium]|nr:hypothetical protein [Polyangia bacterium]